MFDSSYSLQLCLQDIIQVIFKDSSSTDDFYYSDENQKQSSNV